MVPFLWNLFVCRRICNGTGKFTFQMGKVYLVQAKMSSGHDYVLL